MSSRGYLSREEIQWAYGDPAKKKVLLQKWEKKHSRAAANINKRIRKMASANPDLRKDIAQEEYLTDMKYCYCAYGFLPYEYMNYGLSSKTEEEYHEYMSDRDKNLMVYQLNDLKATAVFNDKWRTYETFGEYYHRDCIVIENKKDYQKFQTFVSHHPVFFIKQVYGMSGHDVERKDLSSCPDKAWEIFNAAIRKGKHIVEEPIRQSRKLSEFNASCVNTVRCAMILTRDNPKPATCFFRTGRAGSFVDNAGSGGIFAGIDAETGMLYTSGVDEYGMRYEKHPDSGLTYKGYQLPDWEQLLGICREGSVTAGKRGCKYVGWDLAHTDEFGWVIVEGNSRGQFVEQNASQRGIRDRIEALIAEM